METSDLYATTGNIGGIYMKVENTPTTGQVTFDVYKLDNTNTQTNITTGVVLPSGQVYIDSAVSHSFVKGDVIKFVVTDVDENNVGNPVYFGYY